MFYAGNSVSPRYYRQPYNYQANLLGNLKFHQILNILETSLEICHKCNVHKKNHYCIDIKCRQKQMICPQCDTTKIDQMHYLHDYTYILPLLSRDIFQNFFKLKKKIDSFHQDIKEEIHKMQAYLEELVKIQQIVLKTIENLQEEQEKGKVKDYIKNMELFLKQYKLGDKIGDILENIQFKSAHQCSVKQQQIKNQLITGLNNLKWPKDPQKVLKQKLKTVHQDQRKQIFISAHKSLQLSEIDSNFKANYQFYTSNMENHLIQLKLQSDLLTKPKFYQSFIYHFKNCKKLSIDNGNLSHLRTPLTFRNLRQLQFNFNIDIEPQNIKLENFNQLINSFTFRRFREEDIKVLKNITAPYSELKKLHLEFSNKIDLYNSKDLIQYLKLMKHKNLVQFVLKIRTQSEVKRLYGYLSKFSKESPQPQPNVNLSQAIIQLLSDNPLLTKVVIEGIKPLNMDSILMHLNSLPYLMDYKIYYENVDLMTEVTERQAKQLQNICYKRKRIFYALAKASKQKYLSRPIISHIVSQFLI